MNISPASNSGSQPEVPGAPQHASSQRLSGMLRRTALLGLPVDRMRTAETLACLAEWIDTARATATTPQPLHPVGASGGRPAALPAAPAGELLSVSPSTPCAGSLEPRHDRPVARQVVTLNPEMVMAARRDAALRDAILAADLVLPDGIGILWALRLRGVAISERVTGVDLLDAFARLAAARGYRVFLLGAAPGVADAAASQLASRYSGLVVAGTLAGSPGDASAPAIIERINASGADTVFVAFGTPAQERWIAAHRPQLGAAVAVGVGGAFDFLAGRVPRAPRWMQRCGLEWLYRLARQPWRWRRMLALPRFSLAALRESREYNQDCTRRGETAGGCS